MERSKQTGASTVASRLLALPERIVEALNDPDRQRRTIAAVLLGFVALWTIHGALVHGHHSVHPDVGEAIGWFRDPAGQHHPPVGIWIVGVWFSLFPNADWLVYLLSSSIVGLTLLFAWMLFGDWLDGDKRVVALAMLTLLPFYNFLSTNPNANLVTMPFWAAATLFFLRSFVQPGAMNSALAGVGMAGAMLGKFWSVYLAAGLALAALIDARRLRYLSSAAPWIAAAVAAALLLPYALGLVRQSEALAFAGNTMTNDGHGAALLRSVKYMAGAVGYAMPALLVLAWLRPSRRALAEIAIPSTPDRRLIASVLWLPLVLPALVNLVLPHRLTSLWTYPNWTLLPVVLLGLPLVVVTRRMATRVVAVALLVPMIGVLIAPAVAAFIFVKDSRHPSLHFQAIAEVIESRWRSVASHPLRFIGGDVTLAKGATFYLAAAALNAAPQLQYQGGTAPSFPAEGIVFVCPAGDQGCVTMLDAFTRQTAGQRSEHALTRRYLGMVSPPERFALLIVPPAR